MNFRSLLIPGLLVSLFVLQFCATALRIPDASDAERSGIPVDTLISGRELYIAYCGNCHNLYLPSVYTGAEWAKHLEIMQKKARISNEQKELILKYLTSQAKQ
jgi:hypothetical protein